MRRGVKVLCLMLTALCLTALTGCLGSSEEADDPYTVAVIGKSREQYWEYLRSGANDAAGELGIKSYYYSPLSESEVGEQEELLLRAVDSDADAVIIAPIDTDVLAPIINSASDAGKVIITVDSDLEDTKRIANISTNNYNAGAIAAEYAEGKLKDGKKILIMSHVENAQTARERVDGFEDRFDSKSIFAGPIYCGGDRDKAKELTEKALAEDPEIGLIYATNQSAAEGSAIAVKEMGLKDSVSIIAFDASDAELELLRDGVIDGLMVQNPYNMGYLGVRYAYKALNGEKVNEYTDTGVTYVDQSNIDEDYVRWLLSPGSREESDEETK